MFFLLSVANAPATVIAIVVGGRCRKPGPRVNVFFLPVGVGNALRGISSPGNITVAVVAMVVEQWQAKAFSRAVIVGKGGDQNVEEKFPSVHRTSATPPNFFAAIPRLIEDY